MPHLSSQSHVFGISAFRLRSYLLMFLVSFCLVGVSLLYAADMTPEQKARIQASLAENMPIDQIIREASASGVSMGDIVATLIAAGGDAQRVVYYAVAITSATGNTEGTLQVIRAGIAAVGADSQQSILNSAISGGADTDTVSRAARQAGMSTGSTANALSNAKAADAPALGYSAPAPTPGPTSFTPPAPAPIGGGGGGAPVNPTKPASPTNPNLQRR